MIGTVTYDEAAERYENSNGFSEMWPEEAAELLGVIAGRHMERCRWIATADRLPDGDRTVLVAWADGVWLAYFSSDEEEWRFADGGRCYPDFWMSLPDTPCRNEVEQ